MHFFCFEAALDAADIHLTAELPARCIHLNFSPILWHQGKFEELILLMGKYGF